MSFIENSDIVINYINNNFINSTDLKENILNIKNLINFIKTQNIYFESLNVNYIKEK